MSFTPNQERALKLMEEFKSGPLSSDIRLKSSARISGTFPLPSDFQSNIHLTPSIFNKRPFDDTILNQNDSLIKRKQRKSNEDSGEILNDSMVMASPWEMRKMKGDLIQAKAEIATLESRCNQLHNFRKGDLVLFDQEKKSLKQTIENNRANIAEFESKLKEMRKREQSLKEELENRVGLTDRQCHSLEETNMALKEDNQQLKAKISQLEMKCSERGMELNSTRLELESARSELESVSEHVTRLQGQLGELKVASRQHELDKADIIRANRRIAELESDARNYSETAVLLKEQQAKLMRMAELERQLTLLKSENINLREAPNKLLKLNEVVYELKTRLVSMEETEAILKSTKVELGLALNELNEYKSLSRGIVGDGASYTELTAYVREMQQTRLLAHSDVATLQAKLKTAEETNQSLTAISNSLKSEMSKLKMEVETHTTIIRRLKKQHAIITWERNDLRKLLDSLQKETTVVCNDSKVEALERLVEGYRKRVDQMEQETTGTFSFTSPLPPPDNSAAVDSLKKEIAGLNEKIEKLEYELEHRNLKGDFDTRGTKILHFKLNPTTEAIQGREDALEKAQQEVAILREKIKMLKEGQQVADISQIASDKVHETHSREVEELREKVKSQELQNQRFVEAFKATSREFREAVYTLLGYNVSSVQNKKLFKLTSMYSNSPDQYLLFQMKPEGGMDLLETEMSKSVFDLIDVHLCQNQSLPMFLSSLTVQLFTMQNSQSTLVV